MSCICKLPMVYHHGKQSHNLKEALVRRTEPSHGYCKQIPCTGSVTRQKMFPARTKHFIDINEKQEYNVTKRLLVFIKRSSCSNDRRNSNYYSRIEEIQELFSRKD